MGNGLPSMSVSIAWNILMRCRPSPRQCSTRNSSISRPPCAQVQVCEARTNSTTASRSESHGGGSAWGSCLEIPRKGMGCADVPRATQPRPCLYPYPCLLPPGRLTVQLNL